MYDIYVVKQNGEEIYRGTVPSVAARFNCTRYRVETNKIKGYDVEVIVPTKDAFTEEVDKIEARLNQYGNTVFPVRLNKKIKIFLDELERRGHRLNVRWGYDKAFEDPVKKRKKKVYAILEEM